MIRSDRLSVTIRNILCISSVFVGCVTVQEKAEPSVRLQTVNSGYLDECLGDADSKDFLVYLHGMDGAIPSP